MRTIALRFGEQFAPKCGTIAAHRELLENHGFVWYGKMGASVSKKVINDIFNNSTPKILLIRSGKPERYWAFIEEITNQVPNADGIPEYYRNNTEKFKTWFKIKRIEPAEKNVMGKCFVASSGTPLGQASKQSMSPYFIIDYIEMNP